jgi:cation transport ATPase
MISGDNAVTAQAVAQMVGIPSTNVIAGVLPHEKAQKIQWLQQVGVKRTLPKWKTVFGKRRLNERCIVAMVGDGINDAPALTAADVGVAIGSGSDVALSSASFILLSSNLQTLLTLIDLSRKVFNRVKFNFLYAAMYNCIALPVAAGVLYPVGHIRLAPVWASLAMALSSVSVVCSSLLLKLYKEPKLPVSQGIQN